MCFKDRKAPVCLLVQRTRLEGRQRVRTGESDGVTETLWSRKGGDPAQTEDSGTPPCQRPYQTERKKQQWAQRKVRQECRALESRQEGARDSCFPRWWSDLASEMQEEAGFLGQGNGEWGQGPSRRQTGWVSSSEPSQHPQVSSASCTVLP